MAAYVMELQTMLVLVLVFIHACNTEELRPTEYQFDTKCGELLDMENENITSGTLELTDPSTIKTNFDCWVSILAPPEQRVALRFLKMDLKPHLDSCDHYVQILDGGDNGTVLTARPYNDNDNTSEMYLSSSDREMTILFHSCSLPQKMEGFKVAFTSFHTGICEVGEFKCDNGYCVDGQTRCNGYNNYDDGSDILNGWLGHVVSLGGTLAVICLITFCLRAFIKLSRRGEQLKPPTRGGYIIKTHDQETIPMNVPTGPNGQSYTVNIPVYTPSPESMQYSLNHATRNTSTLPQDRSALPQNPRVYPPTYESSQPRGFQEQEGYQHSSQAPQESSKGEGQTSSEGSGDPSASKQIDEPPPYEEKSHV